MEARQGGQQKQKRARNLHRSTACAQQVYGRHPCNPFAPQCYRRDVSTNHRPVGRRGMHRALPVPFACPSLPRASFLHTHFPDELTRMRTWVGSERAGATQGVHIGYMSPGPVYYPPAGKPNGNVSVAGTRVALEIHPPPLSSQTWIPMIPWFGVALNAKLFTEHLPGAGGISQGLSDGQLGWVCAFDEAPRHISCCRCRQVLLRHCEVGRLWPSQRSRLSHSAVVIDHRTRTLPFQLSLEKTTVRPQMSQETSCHLTSAAGRLDSTGMEMLSHFRTSKWAKESFYSARQAASSPSSFYLRYERGAVGVSFVVTPVLGLCSFA